MQGIRSVKSGDIKTAKSIFIKQINTLKQAGADVIILGCTELPTVVEKDSLLIDSNEALALRCVSWYRANFGAI
jgi:aspartate racemase